MTIVRILGTICVFIILVVLVYVVYKDSAGKTAKKEKKGTKEPKPFSNGPKELVNPPTIFIRLPGQKEYYNYKMTSPTVTIGTGKGNDIVIHDDDTVEKKHAVIKKF